MIILNDEENEIISDITLAINSALGKKLGETFLFPLQTGT